MLHLSSKQIVVYHEDKFLYTLGHATQEIHLKIIKSVQENSLQFTVYNLTRRLHRTSPPLIIMKFFFVSCKTSKSFWALNFNTSLTLRAKEFFVQQPFGIDQFSANTTTVIVFFFFLRFTFSVFPSENQKFFFLHARLYSSHINVAFARASINHACVLGRNN